MQRQICTSRASSHPPVLPDSLRHVPDTSFQPSSQTRPSVLQCSLQVAEFVRKTASHIVSEFSHFSSKSKPSHAPLTLTLTVYIIHILFGVIVGKYKKLSPGNSFKIN